MLPSTWDQLLSGRILSVQDARDVLVPSRRASTSDGCTDVSGSSDRGRDLAPDRGSCRPSRWSAQERARDKSTATPVWTPLVPVPQVTETIVDVPMPQHLGQIVEQRVPVPT